MKIGLLSDIHSNCYALESVMKEASKRGINKFIILGDIFGYYPWAKETFNLIKKMQIFKIVKGNHDYIVEGKLKSSLSKEIHVIAKKNRNDLKRFAPKSLAWLNNLSFAENFKYENYEYTICHGTPEDPINGRYYPDNNKKYMWFPKKNQIVIMGHTHYPLEKKLSNGGKIINPGSVGQPRDDKIGASWIIYDTGSSSVEFVRSIYDIEKVAAILTRLKWNKKAIIALNK